MRPRTCRPIRRLALAPVLLLAACASGAGVAGRPPIPPGVSEEHLHFAEAVAKTGEPAPDFTLPRADERGRVALADLRGRPVVLVFGSMT